jgi:hypothetical protein
VRTGRPRITTRTSLHTLSKHLLTPTVWSVPHLFSPDFPLFFVVSQLCFTSIPCRSHVRLCSSSVVVAVQQLGGGGYAAARWWWLCSSSVVVAVQQLGGSGCADLPAGFAFRGFSHLYWFSLPVCAAVLWLACGSGLTRGTCPLQFRPLDYSLGL